MTFQVKAEVLLNNANWEKNLKKTSKQMEGFGKSMKSISGAVKMAWAGVAALGIGAVYDGLIDITKAAAEDNKSMALLNEQMRRTWHGNEQLNASIDKQIDAMSNATGIADDKLRPALIRIAAVTKNPAKGMKMLKLSTDIAAKSGKDLNMVSMNMAKFLGGNKTALDKLVPGLANSGDRMKFLTEEYAGFAEIAGKNDPFARINVVMDNFKEKLGKAFLPLVNEFADYLAGPEAQKAMDQVAKWAQDTFSFFTSPEGKKAIGDFYQNVKALFGQLMGMVDGLNKFIASFDQRTEQQKKSDEEKKKRKAYGEELGRQGLQTTTAEGLAYTSVDSAARKRAYDKTYNSERSGSMVVNITGLASARQIVSELQKAAKKKGLSVDRLIQGIG